MILSIFFHTQHSKSTYEIDLFRRNTKRDWLSGTMAEALLKFYFMALSPFSIKLIHYQFCYFVSESEGVLIMLPNKMEIWKQYVK